MVVGLILDLSSGEPSEDPRQKRTSATGGAGNSSDVATIQLTSFESTGAGTRAAKRNKRLPAGVAWNNCGQIACQFRLGTAKSCTPTTRNPTTHNPHHTPHTIRTVRNCLSRQVGGLKDWGSGHETIALIRRVAEARSVPSSKFVDVVS